ncbi:MAG TPA: transglutaminase-like domain-containing protein [Nevskiaceae bacterium]|nr:transglutaminase-like domain-containing protein [Nevskiaceae bacterium]
MAARAALLLGLWLVSRALPASELEAARQPTALIDSRSPALIAQARALGAGAASPREQAVAIHDFVRDRIRFGWAPAFYDQRASEVLAGGVGYCVTKTTLFVALLRAAEIPARPRFVDIRAEILEGLIEPGSAYVDHSYAEVWLDGRWIAVDSYIVDQPYADQARARLAAAGRSLGGGVHRRGRSDWDGRTPAFSQYLDDGTVAGLSSRAPAAPADYADAADYFQRGPVHTRLNPLTRWLFGFFSRGANQRLEALRAAGR